MPIYLIFSLLIYIGFFPNQSVAADNHRAKSAAVLFDKQCGYCHQIGVGASSSAGPHLNNLNEREFGSVDYYRYANGLLQASEKGLIWSADTLTEWLKDPVSYIKQVTDDDTSHTRMIYRVNNETERKLIVDYLMKLPAVDEVERPEDENETQTISKCLRNPQPNVDLSGCDLVRVDFSNADLRNANLRNARLIAANLNKANLSGADLTSASLGGADLRGANLSSADFTNATMIKALIPGANTDKTLFNNTIYVNARRCATESIGECQ